MSAGPAPAAPSVARRRLSIQGAVQGVGFRPFVHRLARALGLAGFVRNRASGEVEVEVEGDEDRLERFAASLRGDAALPPLAPLPSLPSLPPLPPLPSLPPLARVAAVRAEALPPRGERGFRVAESGAAASESAASGLPSLLPDAAPCTRCLAELADPSDRRHGYAFIACSDCGPRFTVIESLPYDRERTTLAAFPLCAACAGEHGDPFDRRFHAQPIACPDCGPRLSARGRDGAVLAEGPAALDRAAERLARGEVIALKGVGGYQLACDARSEAAVLALRAGKRRERRPLAVMVPDLAAAAALAHVDEEERALLASPARPIVLARLRPEAGRPLLAPGVAPGLDVVGLLLPSSPLHSLLLERAGGGPLVMTSGNPSGEPIAIDDHEALTGLGGWVGLVLAHDRPIVARCDDPVMRVIAGRPTVLRRGRGLAPAPLRLASSLRVATLAVGGELKGAFALGAGEQAHLSQHQGDLGQAASARAFAAEIARWEQLFGHHPRRVVCDLHPDYASTRYARERALAEGLDLVEVQHHHAHVAACLAEHGRVGPAIGLALDGAGLGVDGAVWGGEVLVGGAREVRRAAHLGYVALPGGDRAAREPWRMAVAHLVAAGAARAAVAAGLAGSSGAGSVVDGTAALSALAAALPGIEPAKLAAVARLAARGGVAAPRCSSAGRLFDAVAAIAGVCVEAQSYEAEAALRLECLARGAPAEPRAAYAFPLPPAGAPWPLEIACGEAIRQAAEDARRGLGAARIARRFHDGLADALATVCTRLRDDTGIGVVALTGGVFANALLAGAAIERLERSGFEVLRHRDAPPGDGGLALGQLAVVAAHDADAGVREAAS